MLMNNQVQHTITFQENKTISYSSLIVFFLAASFYLYEYCLQVSTGVMTRPLMADFGIDAAGLGAISSFYYYAYAPMQLPAGLLFDRFGARKLITLALIICALGAIFFASTDSVFTASMGRFLMGFGSAFSFVGVLVLVARWFPPKYFALMAGIAQLMSSVGAVCGELPLSTMVNQMGWRDSMYVLAVLGFILAGVIWYVVRDTPEKNPKKHAVYRQESEWCRLKTVCTHKQNIFTAIYAFMLWAPVTIFAALWGIPFLMHIYGVSVFQASEAIAMVWLGIGFGSPFSGWISDYLGSRRIPLIGAAILGLASTSLVILVNNIPLPLMFILLFLFGVAAGGQTVSFAVVKENNKARHVGTAAGFNNMAILLGGALFQPVVGLILRSSWQHEMIAGVPIYSTTAYHHALVIIPICYLLALIFSLFFIRESYNAISYK